MSYSQSDWIKAITKLLELTSLGELNWQLTNEYATDGFESVDRAFESIKGSNRYVIKQIRTKYFHDEDDWSWQGGYTFEIYQKLKGSDYERVAAAPPLVIISSLFEAVEGHFAQARGVLDDLL